jgi:hypothetical protein
VVFADIDRHTGQVATPLCPMVIHEAFLPGSEPQQLCEVHGGGNPVKRFFSNLGSLFCRIAR